METKFEVVISGVSGRFPECDDIHLFKNKLYNCDNFITVNDKKWSTNYKFKFDSHIPNATGKYVDVEPFDFRIFKTNSEFSKAFDILNRKGLEPSFEAIVDAGINPYSLDGENIAVFMSCAIDELESRITTKDFFNHKTLIGISRTMQANRISYAFNFKGPSLTYQLDVFGGLQALCAGYNAVANGTVDAAIVGVASNVLDPKLSLQFVALGFLSPDGLCRAFDKHANGYGRSESSVVLFLQRAQDAKRSYGSVLFCDSLYFGSNSSTILGYREDLLMEALESIYMKNNFINKTSDICFMEMNACGIKKLESIESNTIAEIVCKNRNTPLSVGSIKSNVGHTESSAAMMSLLKTLFALDLEIIAPNINHRTLNDEINAFKNKKLKVVDKITKLTGNIVGINSMGISANVSHAILKQNPKPPKKSERGKIPRLLLICGRTETGLMNIINKIEQLPFNEEFIFLANDVFSTHMPSHLYKGYTILPPPFKAVHDVQERGNNNRPIWFVFSGMGSQWNGMGLRLLDIPLFSEIMQKCDKLFKPRGIDIYHALTSDDPTVFDDIPNAFVTITSTQIALIEILKAIGIKPDGIIGHSVGEIACAYADGCLTLEEAMLSSYERGIASVETKTIKGMMAAIGKGYQEIKNSLPEEIDVSCHNSSNSCTLSGPAENVKSFIKQLTDDGIFAKTVNVANLAYHSRYIVPIAPKLLSKLKKLIPNPKERSSKWICTSIPESKWDTPLAKTCSAEYLTNNLVSPVFFEEGCKYIPDNAIVIEIAPHGLLQAVLKRSLPITCTNISLTLRSKTKENINFLLSSIGKIYIAGCEPNVNALFPKINYPVPRGTPSIAAFCDWFHEEFNPGESILKKLPEPPLSSESIVIQLNENSDFHYLRYHKINDRIIIPSSFFMYLTWWMLSIKKQKKLGTSSVLFENIKIHKYVKISIEKPRSVTIMIQMTGFFEIILENENEPDDITVIISGKIEFFPQNTAKINLNKKFPKEMRFTISKEQFYSAFKSVGYNLTDYFATLQEISHDGVDTYAKITWNENWVTFLDILMKIQMHSCLLEKKEFFYPHFIRKLTICCEQFSRLKNGDVVLCYRNNTTNELQCDGLIMHGFECKIYSPIISSVHSKSITFQGLQFFSYSNPQCQDIQHFLELCLQIAVENLPMIVESYKPILCIVNTISQYLENIRSIVKRSDYLKSNIIFYNNEMQFKKMSTHDTCFLLVACDPTVVIKFDFKHMFLLVTYSSNKIEHKFEKNFVLITKQIFAENVFCLYKKKSSFNDCVPSIVWENNNLEKICDLGCKENEPPTYVIRHGIQNDDLSLILTKTKILARNKRYLYLMGKDKTSLEDTERLIKSQLIPDLPVSILKEKEWGTYRNIFTRVNDANNKFTQVEISPSELKSDTVDMRFLGTDCDLETLFNADSPASFSYGIEYSGMHRSGKRVMGLAWVNCMQRIFKPDPLLMWQIPEKWTFEDAVTVPFIYVQAYYILLITHGFGFASSVLINMGNKYLLTETCISVYLNKNYTVYVTVSNSKEASDIKRKFPKLQKSHILEKSDCSYEIQLLQLTKGKGVDIVINCLSGIQHVISSLNCVGMFGNYIDIGKTNCIDLHSLGMNPFLKSISYFIIPNEIFFFTNIPEEMKKNLQKIIESEIKNELIIPFARTILNKISPQNDSLQMQKLKKIVQCFTSEETNARSLKLKFNENTSFIIVAGDDDSWIQLIEWLVNKGVHNCTVILDNLSASARSSLPSRNVSISFKPSNKINSGRNAAEIILETNKLARLEAIYFISLKDSSKKICDMDVGAQLCKLKIPFISLFSGGLEEFESRRSKGLPSVIVHSDKSVGKLANVLSELDYILKKGDPYYAPIIYKINDQKPEIRTEFSALNTYLPKNISNWESAASDVTKTVVFKERTSLSVPYSETKGVYPVFVIPSVSVNQLEPLLKRLLYPVFCATLPESCSSISEFTNEIFQALNKIQSYGPVTIISETWNASTVIELASLIKAKGRKFRLFLLEGDPYEWKSRIQKLGDIYSEEFDDNLTKQIFYFNSKIADGSESSLTKHHFEEKIKYYLSNLGIEENNINLEKNVVKVACAVRDQLRIASYYDLKDNILENTTLFLKYFSENSPLKLSVSSDIIKVKDDNYDDFIANKMISEKINNDAAFSWWDYSK